LGEINVDGHRAAFQSAAESSQEKQINLTQMQTKDIPM
jgi:hypothetical protein